jgi:hypothetical protein
VIAMRSVDLFGAAAAAATLKRGDSLALRRRAGALRRERERILAGGALAVRLRDALRTRPRSRGLRARSRQSAMGAAAQHSRRGARLAARALRRVPRRRLVGGRRARWCRRGLRRAGGSRRAVRASGAWRSLLGAASSRCWCRQSSGARSPAAARARSWPATHDCCAWRTGPEAPCAFDAAVYPSVLVATRCERPPTRGEHGAVRRRRSRSCGAGSRHRSGSIAAIRASPWLLVATRGALPLRPRRGPRTSARRLRASDDRALGVKCGCNEAFAVSWPAAPART